MYLKEIPCINKVIIPFMCVLYNLTAGFTECRLDKALYVPVQLTHPRPSMTVVITLSAGL